MHLVEVKGISKKEGGTWVVKDIHFTQQPLQKIAITGATGSGKSSLLKIIAGLVAPTKGSVLFNGERVLGPDERLLPGHPKIAYLSQYFELRNHYRVKDFLSMASKVSESEGDRIYRLCRIEQFLERWTHQLSGGEKQRIALARLLITSPQLLLLDEPFSNLDPFHKSTLKTVIDDLSNELNITCMLVSHDPVDTLGWADEIIVLKDGELIQQGNSFTTYHYPIDEYTAALFGKYNRIGPALAKELAELGITSIAPFIRPEKIEIVTPDQGIAGSIVAIRFMGGFYELEVAVKGQNLLVRTNKSGLQTGEGVHLLLSA